MDISALMDTGVTEILGKIARYYMKSGKGGGFLAHMLPRARECAGIRQGYEEGGDHIPSFLIASVASRCNLSCAGCYARAGGACGSVPAETDLDAGQWRSVFEEAARLGIPFILLAGGEPFLRRDVIEAAASAEDVVFPVFTNGTMIDEAYLKLLDESRNVIPVFSIEGRASETDKRRGAGVYAAVYAAMRRLHEKDIMFGASITVTSENMYAVTEPSFVGALRELGCGAVFYVEYVPVSGGTGRLELDAEEAAALNHAARSLKADMDDMVILSFPGDEAAMGGCLASGRGFFHINASGGAEPCPFSPYAVQSLKTSSILEVLRSGYFAKLRELAQNAGEHTGGCTLFKQVDKVLALSNR